MGRIYSKISILFLLLILFSCSKNDDDGTSSNLPEITSEGANTFGCYINGQVFLPKNGDGWCLNCGSQIPWAISYSKSKDQYYLGILATNNINGDVLISIDLHLDEPLEERVFELSESYVASIDKINPNASSCIYRKINGEKISSCFETTTDVTGTLEIIEINESEHFIAGIFEFEAISQEGKIVNFTEGRFDLEVPTL